MRFLKLSYLVLLAIYGNGNSEDRIDADFLCFGDF